MEPTERTSLDRLMRQAEQALRTAKSPAELERPLEKLARSAPEGSSASLFAHRHLAELRLEKNPWQAALHLRQAAKAGAQDDVVHALTGLSHALLGNFRTAIAAYKRALQIQPQSPWYHHNVGHLLDVGLGRHDLAEPHLRKALDLEPGEPEIRSSLARCLGAAGKLAEARELAREVIRAEPKHAPHRELLDWIESSIRKPGASSPAPGSLIARAMSAENPPTGEVSTPTRRKRASKVSRDPVLSILREKLRDDGWSKKVVASATAMWSDYVAATGVDQDEAPAVLAAAVEFAFLSVCAGGNVTRASVAKKYQVPAGRLGRRCESIKQTLGLIAQDPRYFR